MRAIVVQQLNLLPLAKHAGEETATAIHENCAQKMKIIFE